MAEKNTAKKEIKRSRDFLQAVIDAISDQMLVIDRDYRVVLANQTARSNSREDDPVSMGIYCYQMSHRRDSPCKDIEHPCPLKEVIETGEIVTTTHTHYAGDGSEITIEINASPIFNDSGEVIYIVETCQDVTERKRAEEDLRESEFFLNKTQKVAQLGGWKLNPETNFLAWTMGVYDIIEAPLDYKPGLKEGLKY